VKHNAVMRSTKLITSLNSKHCRPSGIPIRRQNSYAPRSRRCTGHREVQSREPVNESKIIKCLIIRSFGVGTLMFLTVSCDLFRVLESIERPESCIDILFIYNLTLYSRALLEAATSLLWKPNVYQSPLPLTS
jgi:hypothetical protein